MTEGYTDGRQNEICEKVYISFGTLIKSNIQIITKDQHLSRHVRMFQIFTQASNALEVLVRGGNLVRSESRSNCVLTDRCFTHCSNINVDS